MSEKKNISKKELRRRKRKRALMIKTGILCVLLVIFGIGIWALAGGTEKIQQKAQEKEDQKTAEVDAAAIWAIGKGIGKPSVASSEVGWEPGKALCLAQVASKKYQLTLKAGETLKTSGDPEVISFKFFHQNDWGGEFGNYANSILVEQLKLADSGNLEMQDNKAFEEGAVYRFTIDVTNGNANADLKVEKIN